MRYTSAVELVRYTIVPYETRQTLKTSHETDIPSPSFSLVTAMIGVGDLFTPTILEATEFSDTPTSGFPPVTLVPGKSDIPPYYPRASWGK